VIPFRQETVTESLFWCLIE